jgi:hypothetical protein
MWAEIREKSEYIECLEWYEAKFLRGTTATLQQRSRARFFCFVLGL